jgi:hypothetical protein
MHIQNISTNEGKRKDPAFSTTIFLSGSTGTGNIGMRRILILPDIQPAGYPNNLKA